MTCYIVKACKRCGTRKMQPQPYFFKKLTDDSPSPYKKLALKFHLVQYLKNLMQPQPYFFNKLTDDSPSLVAIPDPDAPDKWEKAVAKLADFCGREEIHKVSVF